MASFLQALFAQYAPQVQSSPTHRLPAEWEPHERTFIVWPTNNVIDTKVDAVRQEIVLLAQAIAKYEPVVVLARPDLVDSAQSSLGSTTATNTNIQVVALAIDGFWTRDTAPVFLIREPQGDLTGVDFNVSGWYQRHQLQGIPKLARTLLEKYAVPRTKAVVVAEGGAIETDGLGTLLVTQRSLINQHRNPTMSREEIDQELIRTLGVKKIIWLTPDENIIYHEYGPLYRHEDPRARFLAPGVVALSRPHRVYSREYNHAAQILAAARDSRGLPLTVVDIEDPWPEEYLGLKYYPSPMCQRDIALSYLNFYIANGAVFVPQYGQDRTADKLVLRVLAEQFPGREVVPVRMDAVVSVGGGIHLATRHQPRCGLMDVYVDPEAR
ncbi:hypothetical protein BGZ93_006815 [Podila epicladia]|nr:hypothetical protein BGZ92_002393 [Podila epicladia]KAG0094743.1 hypothetical protein BGZ93_006815 [Podila epicladia]